MYPNNSTLDSAIRVYNAEIDNDDYEDDSATSTENSNSIDDLVFDENQVTGNLRLYTLFCCTTHFVQMPEEKSPNHSPK